MRTPTLALKPNYAPVVINKSSFIFPTVSSVCLAIRVIATSAPETFRVVVRISRELPVGCQLDIFELKPVPTTNFIHDPLWFSRVYADPLLTQTVVHERDAPFAAVVRDVNE